MTALSPIRRGHARLGAASAARPASKGTFHSTAWVQHLGRLAKTSARYRYGARISRGTGRRFQRLDNDALGPYRRPFGRDIVQRESTATASTSPSVSQWATS